MNKIEPQGLYLTKRGKRYVFDVSVMLVIAFKRPSAFLLAIRSYNMVFLYIPVGHNHVARFHIRTNFLRKCKVPSDQIRNQS